MARGIKKTICMMAKKHYRTWFPHIVIGLTVLLAIGVYILFSNRDANTTDHDIAQSIVIPTSEEYRENVSAIIETYYADENREDAFGDLLNQIVPAEERDIHVEIILLFDQPSDTRANIEQGLLELKSAHSWLP